MRSWRLKASLGERGGVDEERGSEREVDDYSDVRRTVVRVDEETKCSCDVSKVSSLTVSPTVDTVSVLMAKSSTD